VRVVPKYVIGDPRPFTFLTIETTPNQLKKCMYTIADGQDAADSLDIGLNIMSGSTWRGTTLRLAEAKPKYLDRWVSLLTSDLYSLV
jgi:hypothetical protein